MLLDAAMPTPSGYEVRTEMRRGLAASYRNGAPAGTTVANMWHHPREPQQGLVGKTLAIDSGARLSLKHSASMAIAITTKEHAGPPPQVRRVIVVRRGATKIYEALSTKYTDDAATL